MYPRCWSCLVLLGANQSTQNWLKVLKREDVKASTAVLNSNEPGSTTLRLSWIWQTSLCHNIGLISTINAIAEPNTNSNTNAKSRSIAVPNEEAVLTSSANQNVDDTSNLFECESIYSQ